MSSMAARASSSETAVLLECFDRVYIESAGDGDVLLATDDEQVPVFVQVA